MNLSNLPLFAALTEKMGWLSDRQKVLAENIANIDTPRYQASDLRPLDFSGELGVAQRKLEPVATNPAHMIPVSDTASVPDDERIASPEDRAINGNTVSAEDEMIKVSQNSADYQLMTNLYKKQLGMLKMAIGQGGASSGS
jgi:flagellar basal-body rod protein FlgB